MLLVRFLERSTSKRRYSEPSVLLFRHALFSTSMSSSDADEAASRSDTTKGKTYIDKWCVFT
jgi:hypothetical protein